MPAAAQRRSPGTLGAVHPRSLHSGGAPHGIADSEDAPWTARAAYESLEVESAGALAYEMGRYTLYAGDNDVDKGKYVLIWKREAGQRRIHRDIVNSSRPA